MFKSVKVTILICLFLMGSFQVLIGWRAFGGNLDAIQAKVDQTTSLESLRTGYLALADANILYGKGAAISGATLIAATLILLLGARKDS